MAKVLFPRSVSKNAKIAVITPAGFIQKGQLDRTLELIHAQGFEPILGKHVYSKYVNGYNYGGTPEERKSDFQWALDGDFEAIWTTRGGYGCAHLIQGLNLRKFKQQPKFLIGYSDVTVLNSFLLKRGFASIHGQSIKTGSMGVSPEAYAGIFQILKGGKPSYILPAYQGNRRGTARGILVGGNLAMIYSLMGSRYEYDFREKVLFIEDVGENYYALDRMLMNLELNGVFKKIKALLIGGMTLMGEEDSNKEYEKPFDPLAYKIVAERIASYDFPVAFGVPNGHIFDNRPLIIGGEVAVTVKDGAEIQFL